ncbi:hypothetical protein OCAE111667_19990 [Occultella aeris]|uniref:Uncharacterized protein n=2 Tax=Occultella aeris TaxID=2761496 RepID=A0A7M4DJQ1_9MICO|nr:hypothetical protein HALOF300_02358 [Occultella aeris]
MAATLGRALGSGPMGAGSQEPGYQPGWSGSVQGASSGWQSQAPHRTGTGAPVRVDLRPNAKGILIQVAGTVLTLGVGLVAVFGGLASDQGFVPIAVGAIFLLAGLLPLLTMPKVLRARALEIGPMGLDYQDPKGYPWAVRWVDLAAVDVKYGHSRSRGGPFSDGVVVALEFSLHPGADAQYPNLGRYRRGEVYRLSLGQRGDLLGPLAQPLGAFAPPQVFHGVTNLGSILAGRLI